MNSIDYILILREFLCMLYIAYGELTLKYLFIVYLLFPPIIIEEYWGMVQILFKFTILLASWFLFLPIFILVSAIFHLVMIIYATLFILLHTSTFPRK